MLQLSNETPFAAERGIQLDPEGVQHWVVIVKATYTIEPSGQLMAAREQEPVAVKPRYLGEEGKSSLLRETEMTFAHPGTDVIVNASAHAPAGTPVRELDVHVAVGKLRKSLRVFGERKWISGLLELVPSTSARFTTMPITWERAYGGVGPESSGAGESRNPIGRGFAVRREELVDRWLPNVEDPKHLIHGWRDRPPPAGLRALGSHWSPRREHAGTYDAAWEQNKLPLLPDDFDPLFFAAATPELHARQALVGGEPVYLQGLTPGGQLAFNVPREVLLIDTWLGGRRMRLKPQLDRVIIEPDDARVVAVWRAALKCGPRFRDISRTRVDYKIRISR